eukprot:TRINITY_DN871_c0_g1_i9.p1 TRINITY_DN871_c0_g1~~TRINITY_DN871_c0_g1_i9.p1  ORF type:complete len:757 (+),score=200.92 TRINITY_DN871_c0_g1_i9:63-2273(+)
MAESAPLVGGAAAGYGATGDHGHSHDAEKGHGHSHDAEKGHGHSHDAEKGHGHSHGDADHGHSHGGHGHGHDHGAGTSPAYWNVKLHEIQGKGCSRDETGAMIHRGAEKDRTESIAQRRRAKLALKACIALCFFFMTLEIIGGYIANSLAIMTDAAHLLADVGSLAISLWSLNVSDRPADYEKMDGGSPQLTFGWHRADALGTLTSIATIWFLTAVILWKATERTFLFTECALGDHPGSPVAGTGSCIAVDGNLMMIIGFLGLAVNLMMAGILKLGGDPPVQHAHSHDGGGCGGHGGHSHGGHGGHGGHGDHGHGGGNDGTSVNVESAFLHALSDCLNSAGVIIASAVIWAGNSWAHGVNMSATSWYNLADPACSFVFGVLTIRTTYGLAREMISILMEACPPGINYNEVLGKILMMPGVIEVHDLHIWSLTRGEKSLSVHVTAAAQEGEDEHQATRAVLARVQNLVSRKYGIAHSTVQVEVQDDCCVARCHGLMHGVHGVSASPVEQSPVAEPMKVGFPSDHGHSHGAKADGHAHGGGDHGHSHGGKKDGGHSHGDGGHGHSHGDGGHGHSHGDGGHGHSHGEKGSPKQADSGHGHSHGDGGHGDGGHGHSHGEKGSPKADSGHGHSHGDGGHGDGGHGHSHGEKSSPKEEDGGHGHSHGADSGHAHAHGGGEQKTEGHGHSHGGHGHSHDESGEQHSPEADSPPSADGRSADAPGSQKSPDRKKRGRRGKEQSS